MNYFATIPQDLLEIPKVSQGYSLLIFMLGVLSLGLTVLTVLFLRYVIQSSRKSSDDPEEMQSIIQERRNDWFHFSIAAVLMAGSIFGLVWSISHIQAGLNNAKEHGEISQEYILEALHEKYDIQSAKLHFNPDNYTETHYWLSAATKDMHSEDASSITSVHLKDDSVYEYEVFLTPQGNVVLESLDSSEESPAPTELLK